MKPFVTLVGIVAENVFWTFGELEAVLANVHGIDQWKRTAFQSRLKNFHRLNYPIGFRAIKGKATLYSPLQIADMALAVEMTQLGLPPERATWVLSANRWPTLMAIEMVARELASDPSAFNSETGLADSAASMFLYFDPAALHPLTLHLPANVLPDLDEAANSFFYGGMGIVRESIVGWTSGRANRISLINLTALVGNVVASPFDEGTGEDLTYREEFFRKLEAEARSSRDDWQGGDEAEADYVLGLLERDEITDVAVLAERANISASRAARYLHEEAERQGRRRDDSNSQA